jgi:TrmH family RNA methyltransferase
MSNASSLPKWGPRPTNQAPTISLSPFSPVVELSLACRRIERLPALSKLDRLVVVLVRPRNPLNVGAAARAMSNFGAQWLRLVNPYAVAFREARSAIGALDLLKNAEEFQTVAEAVADCALVVGTTAVGNRALENPLRRLDTRAGSVIRQQLKTGRVALLFGSEKIGLTNEDFTHCHWLLNVPTHEEHISMNLGQAVAVCLYELARDAAPKVEKQSVERATAAVNEQITQALLEALHRSGYVKPGTKAISEKKVRRLMLRLNLESMDAKVLLGMMRQIVWELRRTARN